MIVCGHRINPQQPFDLVYEAIRIGLPSTQGSGLSLVTSANGLLQARYSEIPS